MIKGWWIHVVDSKEDVDFHVFYTWISIMKPRRDIVSMFYEDMPVTYKLEIFPTCSRLKRLNLKNVIVSIMLILDVNINIKLQWQIMIVNREY